jgi:hemerythrin
MKKTNNLLSKYLRLYKEQVPGEEVVNADPQTQVAPAADPAPVENSPESNLSENEKYVIKILTNAFIFNPKVFDKDKQKYIYSRIESIKKMINIPISKVIDEVKNIISLDSSLKVESKTIALLRKYIMLTEQSADATEQQSNNNDQNTELAKQANKEQSEGEGNKVSLEEIFPLYKELILKSLKHTPTEEELMILKPVVNEFANVDPEKIVEAIQNLLVQSTEDKEVRDNLSNA